MKKNNLFFISILMIVLMLTACGGNDSNDNNKESTSNKEESVKTIRAAITLSPESSLFKGLEYFKEIVEENSEGSLKVDLHHSGQLGDDRVLIEGLQMGSLEMAAPITGSLSGFVEEMNILDFPFLFPNEKVADQVLDGEAGQNLLNKLEDQGIIGLGYWENGFRSLSNNVRPVEKLEDWKGLSVRSMPNEMSIEAMESLGAGPTPMAFTELFTALQQGVVDGQENPYTVIYDNKIYEVQKYLSDTKHSYSAFSVMMSKMFYDTLTEEEQEIVSNAIDETTSYQRNLNREQSIEFLDLIIESGVTFTEITSEDREEMVAAIQPVIEKYSVKFGEESVNEILSAIEDAK